MKIIEDRRMQRVKTSYVPIILTIETEKELEFVIDAFRNVKITSRFEEERIKEVIANLENILLQNKG